MPKQVWCPFSSDPSAGKVSCSSSCVIPTATPLCTEIAESRLAALQASGSADSADQILSGNASARKAVNFQWQEVLLAEGTLCVTDAVYELASVLVSLAVWKQKRAVHITQAGQAGSPSETSIKVCCADHAAVLFPWGLAHLDFTLLMAVSTKSCVYAK